jgi:hypothetical protein
MRQKYITALSLVVAFAVIFGTQVATSASANTKNGSPLTSPVTFFKISGNVTYKFFKFFSNNGQRFAPATGVTVTAENVFNKNKYQTTTDLNGNYTLPVEEKGVYLVGPSGGNTNVYTPALQVVHANKAGVKSNVNFHGLMLP